MARYNQRNGAWQVVIELGRDERTGKRLRHTKDGFKTKKEAIAYATIKENELLNGITPVNNKTLLKDFISNWYDDHISKANLSINTITNYKSRIDTHIIPYMGSMQLSKIKVTDVQAFYHKLVDDGLKPDSAKRVIQTLNKCLKYAKKMKLINDVPCDIEFFKDVKDNKIKAWNEDQLILFLDKIKGTYLYSPVFIAAFTGMRIGELCGLRQPNVNLIDKKVQICEQTLNDKLKKTLIHTDILKTSKSSRTITIPSFLVKFIKDNLKESTQPKIDDFIIEDRKGGICNPRNLSMDFTKKVLKYVPEINEENKDNPNFTPLPIITFHDLRHTHATILLMHGENIKVISERLGHESIKITLDTYSHVMPSMEEHTSLLLDSLFKDRV